MQAIILAGGFGTRLQSAVSNVPKPLAPVHGRPFLAWLIDYLAQQHISQVTLSVHHQWEKIRDYFDKHPAPIPIRYVVEETPLGTGGAIAHALAQCNTKEPMLIINGDTVFMLDYKALFDEHRQSGATLTMSLREVPNTGRYGKVVVHDGIVTDFSTGTPGKMGLINAGVYVMEPTLFTRYEMPRSFSFEREFLPAHLIALKPRAFAASGYFVDIGIPEDYIRAQRELPEMLRENVA